MSESRTPFMGPGKFQWNPGSWFGSSLGGSVWMLVMAALLVMNDQPKLAMVPAFAFEIIGAAAIILWSRRDRVPPFKALMVELGLMAIAFPLVWLIVRAKGDPSTLQQITGTASPMTTLLVFGVSPAIIVLFGILENAAIRQSAVRKHPPTGK